MSELILSFISNFNERVEPLMNVLRINPMFTSRLLRCIKGKLFQQSLKHRVQPARTDIFGAGVHLCRYICQRRNSVAGEVKPHLFGGQQRDVLLRQCIFRLGQNANEIVLVERFKFNADWKPTLELRNEI